MQVYARMDLRFLPIILLLAPLNYLLRFVKWNYYLKISHITPQPRMNRYVFLSGLSMTITPGKLGELLKCYLLKEHIGAPVSKTSSIVIAERVTDALGMVLLLACSLLAFPFGKTLLPVCAALLLSFILFFRFDQPINFLREKFAAPGKNKYIVKGLTFLAAFQQNSKVLLAPRHLLYATAISFISWGFEGFIVYFAAQALGGHISVLGSVFVVSFSSLLGAVSFLPGGLGVAEGSIMAILMLTGMSSEMAAAVTIITRFSTLWLGVLVGIAGLALVQRELSRQKAFHQEN
jgi:uncharacterized protein (TIRG00374 family)